MNAAQADKQAIESKFRTELAAHVLDDLNGKAPANVRASLRSSAHADAWHLELMRLLANAPRGAFWDKIEAKRKEAVEIRKTLSRKLHYEKQLAKKPDKLVGSSANLGQIAAMILSAHIKSGTPLRVQATLCDVRDLVRGLSEMSIEENQQ